MNRYAIVRGNARGGARKNGGAPKKRRRPEKYCPRSLVRTDAKQTTAAAPRPASYTQNGTAPVGAVPYLFGAVFRFSAIGIQFFRLWIGAGIRPPRAINFAGEYVFSGMTGARPSSPPKSTVSPTP